MHVDVRTGEALTVHQRTGGAAHVAGRQLLRQRLRLGLQRVFLAHERLKRLHVRPDERARFGAAFGCFPPAPERPSLLLFRRRPCSQVLLPPQSLHLLRCRPCSHLLFNIPSQVVQGFLCDARLRMPFSHRPFILDICVYVWMCGWLLVTCFSSQKG